MSIFDSIDKGTNGQPSPGEIIRAVVKEVSLVNRPANGRPFLLIKNEDGSSVEMSLKPSQQVISELQDCGYDVEALTLKAEAASKGEAVLNPIEKSLMAVMTSVIELEKNLDDEDGSEILDKANQPVQRQQLLGFLADWMENVTRLLRRAKVLPDDDATDEKKSKEKSKGKASMSKAAGESQVNLDDIKNVMAEGFKSLGESLGKSLTDSLAQVVTQLKPAPVETPAEDPLVTSLKKQVEALTAQINAETAAQEQAGKVEEIAKNQGHSQTAVQVLQKSVDDLNAKLESLKKFRLGSQQTPPAGEINLDTGLTEEEILKAATRLAASGGIIGQTGQEIRTKYGQG